MISTIYFNSKLLGTKLMAIVIFKTNTKIQWLTFYSKLYVLCETHEFQQFQEVIYFEI